MDITRVQPLRVRRLRRVEARVDRLYALLGWVVVAHAMLYAYLVTRVLYGAG